MDCTIGKTSWEFAGDFANLPGMPVRDSPASPAGPERPGQSGRQRTIVFTHAHPDDEAIFTGGVMALLARRGWRVVLVLATRGELGIVPDELARGSAIAEQRMAESENAAAQLGLQRVEHLGYRDSGMAGDPANEAPGAFATARTEEAVDRLAVTLAEERPAALVTYDPRGIYGHPDHVKIHEVAVEAAAVAGIPTVYEATVDREYLHFVETHVVVEVHGAERPPGLGLAASTLGLPSVAITCTVDVRSVLDVKRRYGCPRQPDPGPRPRP